VALLFAPTLFSSSVEAQGHDQPYTIIDLGSFFPEAINGLGQIAGTAETSPGQWGAFRWQGGILQKIDMPVGPGGSIAVLGINDAGHVVGWADLPEGKRAFLWTGNAFTVLQTLGGATSVSNALNALDQAAGYATGPDEQQRAVVWSGSTTTALGSLGGRSFANGLNDVGQVVGQSDTGQGSESRAFLYDGGVMTDLGTLGGSQSAGYAIRNDGVVLGLSTLAGDEVSHPFLWQNGAMTDLGVLPGTTGTTELVNTITSHGEMVGYSQLTPDGAERHAVLYQDGSFTDLNTVLPAASGWSLVLAQRINDAGQIVGTGYVNGQYHGFLLIPPGATVSGDEVLIAREVELPNNTAAPVTVEFESVVTGGETTITASSTGPSVPSGFQLPEAAAFYEVHSTAIVSGAITLCFSWMEGALQSEANATLLHFENGQWVDITRSVDTHANTVCGEATSLSPFVVAERGFEFLGFREPLLAAGTASIQQTKGGRTIPVKFQLSFQGHVTGAATATISVYKVLDVAVGTVDTTDLTADAGIANDTSNRFRYDSEAGQYVFNLSSKGWQAPATYRIAVTVSDGTVHTVDFSLRK